MKRRDFLANLSTTAALAATVPNVWRVTARPRLADDPFQLGVACGDPTPTGGVLWTRLAPRPLEPEGGMDGQRVVVTLGGRGRRRVSHDRASRGARRRRPSSRISVHVDVDGLAPDRWYFYRFTVRRRDEPRRAGCAPRRRQRASTPLRFAVASCQHYEQGLFTAYAHMAREELDLVAHLGDYIYEYGDDAPDACAQHVGLEIRTLDDYRRRYAQYKADPLLQAAHARCPWLVTWDDHEVDNNYAGVVRRERHGVRGADARAPRRRLPGVVGASARARAARARRGRTSNITRALDWGALARFWVLDSRQYRSDQACERRQRHRPVRRAGPTRRARCSATRRSDG